MTKLGKSTVSLAKSMVSQVQLREKPKKREGMTKSGKSIASQSKSVVSQVL
jgi:hypothetical protein